MLEDAAKTVQGASFLSAVARKKSERDALREQAVDIARDAVERAEKGTPTRYATEAKKLENKKERVKQELNK
jgi:hypothetical protein